MPASTEMPDVTVAIAFTTAPNDPNPEWQDVTAYVEAVEGIDSSRGRADELSQVQPSTLGVTLDNSDGRFTPERSASPYYPNVKKSKRIRVSTRWPLDTPGNFLSANDSSFVTDVSGWQAYGAGYGGGSVAWSTVRAQIGASSALITWPTFAGGSLIATSIRGLIIGKTYTASAYVYVVAGQPNVRLTRANIDSGAFTSVKDAWVRISHTFVATSSALVIGVEAVNTTAGQQCWVDAVQVDEGSTVIAYSNGFLPIYHRFSGYIDEWPLEWPDGTSSAARSRITATSRQARMAKGSELRSIIECEYLQDNPRAYYTFGDPTGTTRAGNTSTMVQPTLSAASVGTGGGGITFGTATGPGTDDLTACQFSPAAAGNGFYMRGLFDQPIVDTEDSEMIECFFSTTTAGRGLLSLDGVSLTWSMALSVDSAGKLKGQSYASGGSLYILTSAATVADGATHHAALREQVVAGTTTATLFLDGVAVGSSATASIFRRDRLSVGAIAGSSTVTAESSNSLFNGVLAHIAVYNTFVDDTRILAHAQAGLTGFSGERSDQRIVRLARYAGVPASEVATETGLSTSLTNQLTGAVQPIALMQDVTKTEAGNLFDAGNGVLTFQARGHRYNSASSLTLSATLQEIEGGLNPRLDDQGMANDVTASRTAGITMRATDAASIADYGIYRDDLPLLTTDDNEVADAAYWNLNQRSTPLTRIPACSVDLLNASSGQKTALLRLELGDKITLTGLPTQAPSPSLDFFVEGIAEKLGAESYDMTLNLSPAAQYGVWQLDSATYSVLDSTTRLAY